MTVFFRYIRSNHHNLYVVRRLIMEKTIIYSVLIVLLSVQFDKWDSVAISRKISEFQA